MKWGLCGASGRMGAELKKLMPDAPCLTLDESGLIEKDRPDVIFDFSSAAAADQVIALCQKHGAALISGTTALSAGQEEALRRLGDQVTVVRGTNFSLGIALMTALAKKIDRALADWDVAITETHHSAKKDAPSGTALTLAAALSRPCAPVSLRLGGVPGDHTALWGNSGEVLSLSHRALNRSVFALGAIKAAEKALNHPKGYFTFHELIQGEIGL